MISPATPSRVAKADAAVGRMPNQPNEPTGHGVDPNEVGMAVLGERLLAAARIASVLHAQAIGPSGQHSIGAAR